MPVLDRLGGLDKMPDLRVWCLGFTYLHDKPVLLQRIGFVVVDRDSLLPFNPTLFREPSIYVLLNVNVLAT